MSLPAGATAVYNSSGLQYYRHADWLGSSRLVSTTSHTVSGDTAYAPFGYAYAQSGSPALSFTGHFQDTAANLYDFMYREYGVQGRWPSPDPLDTGAFNLADPQSLDLYSYVRNSPMMLTDPLGLDVNGGKQSVSVTAEPVCYVLEMGGVFLFQPVPEYLQSFCPGGGGKDSYYGDYGISVGGFTPEIPGGGAGPGGSTAGTPQTQGQRQRQKEPCTPLANDLTGTPAAGFDTIVDALHRLASPLEMAKENAFIFVGGVGAVAGGAAAITAGCLDPTPFEPATCGAGILGGAPTIAGGGVLIKEGVSFFKDYTLPAIEDWGCHE